MHVTRCDAPAVVVRGGAPAVVVRGDAKVVLLYQGLSTCIKELVKKDQHNHLVD